MAIRGKRDSAPIWPIADVGRPTIITPRLIDFAPTLPAVSGTPISLLAGASGLVQTGDMSYYSPEIAILVIGLLLAATVLAGTLSSRFGLPALIGFLGLGMIAGSDGIGIAFDNYELAQAIGVLCLIFILFSGGLDTDLQAARRVAAPAIVLATFGVFISAAGSRSRPICCSISRLYRAFCLGP